MGDTYIAYRLLKETLRRVVGIPTDASLLTTIVVLGVSVSVLRRLAAPVLRASRPEAPSFATTMMAAAVVREIPGGIGGGPARNTPFAGTMIMISMVAPTLRVIAVFTHGVGAVLSALARVWW